MKLEQVLDWVLELEIHYFTVYALSTENLNRPDHELEGLFNLYIEGLKDIADDPRIHENKVKVQIIGKRELLPENVNQGSIMQSRMRITTNIPSQSALPTEVREMLGAIQSIAKDHVKFAS